MEILRATLFYAILILAIVIGFSLVQKYGIKPITDALSQRLMDAANQK
jgi:type II secretory pathway component PulL